MVIEMSGVQQIRSLFFEEITILGYIKSRMDPLLLRLDTSTLHLKSFSFDFPAIVAKLAMTRLFYHGRQSVLDILSSKEA